MNGEKNNSAIDGQVHSVRMSRRGWLKWGLLTILAVMPFVTLSIRRKRQVELPYLNMHEIVFSKPKGVKYGEFFPNKNKRDREMLNLDSAVCSDAEIIGIDFTEFGDNYYVGVELQFVSEKPDPKKEYHFELIAYDQNGTGFAYSSGRTRDLRTKDLNAEGRESTHVSIREMTVRPVFSLDVMMSQAQYKKLGQISLFCTASIS